MSKLTGAIEAITKIPVGRVVHKPILDEQDWRMIHNALVSRQSVHPSQTYRDKLQTLMDKVRDNFIAK